VHPNVVVTELSAAYIDGIKVLEEMRRKNHAAGVVLTECVDHALLRRAMHAGASVLLSKQASPEELRSAVILASAGQHYMDNRLSGLQHTNVEQGNDQFWYTWHSLTNRERDVLLLYLDGARTTEIAGALGISARTVEFHVGNVMEKFGVHSRSSLHRMCAVLPVEQTYGATATPAYISHHRHHTSEGQPPPSIAAAEHPHTL
jgi:DNA-binding NarL/FixJ family response regulator